MSEALFAETCETVPEVAWAGEPFGTVVVDPPWAYERASKHQRLTGYANYEYATLSTRELAALPVRDVVAQDCVLLLWATWPFLPDALALVEAWGFTYKTGLPWVKVDSLDAGSEPAFKPTYGVGYWMRGCTEPIVVGARGRSWRTQWVGLLSEAAVHSRKPATVYELAESFGTPRLELFPRERRPGWVALGNEVDGRWAGDVRETLPELARQVRRG